MSTAIQPVIPGRPAPGTPSRAKTYLNAYEIQNANQFAWDVNVYSVEFADRSRQRHENRGELKDIFWSLWRQHKSQWRGPIFVLDLNAKEVAVPAHWKLAGSVETPEYRVTLARSFRAQAADRAGRAIIAGILREAIKKHFKDNGSEQLGDLWQDYDAFCQNPVENPEEDYLLCRRFSFQVKPLAGGILAVQCAVGTTTVDSQRFSDHSCVGELASLLEMIEAKRAGHVNRQNRPVAVRVLRQYAEGSTQAKVLELEDVQLLSEWARIGTKSQASLCQRTVLCKQFPDTRLDVPLSELRLILASQNTQEEHGETILEPGERWEWMQKMRDFIHGAAVHDQELALGTEPLDTERFAHRFVLPPVVRVRGDKGKEVHISSPRFASEKELEDRARARVDHIRRNGFLTGRPINPALAWPANLGETRGKRFKNDLERIWAQQRVDARFEFVCYRSVEEIRIFMENGKHDSLFAVLPEGSDAVRHDGDTHELIKRTISEPSQCLHHNNTLPLRLLSQSWEAMFQSNAERRRARRIQNTYAICLGNLLVKHHWFPFAPRDPFHYNVHVGLDVGGVHNTQVMACLGYGFRRPDQFLLFLPREIPVEVQKREPIPTESLYSGLLKIFEEVHAELTSAGLPFDYNSTLFHRDGQLLGEGELWNEQDALLKLRQELRRRGWIDDHAIWTAAEYLKGAEHWRLFRSTEDSVCNPLVGQVSFPFEDENVSIIATTGAPYLTQGTAQPLLVRISDIHGQFRREQVTQDILWQADMCFTKPDMGMRLPWVLNVADSGALQLARSYRISGVTV